MFLDEKQLEVRIPYEVLVTQNDPQRIIAHERERLLWVGREELFKNIVSAGSPVVVDYHLEEYNGFMHEVQMKFHYRIYRVQTVNVSMPVFDFYSISGQHEWKCPACSTINKWEATYCGELHKHVIGCGHFREEVH